MRDEDNQRQSSPAGTDGSHFPELRRCGTFPEEMLKNTWLCSLEVNNSRSCAEAGRWVVNTGDKRRTKTFWHITRTVWKKCYCLFVDKYNYINSTWRRWEARGCPWHLTDTVQERLSSPAAYWSWAGNSLLRHQGACLCPPLCWEGQKE